MTFQADFLLAHGKRQAGSDPKLLLYQIQSRHKLCHRMLHLDTGVHLHEVKTSVSLQEKFNGSGIDITCCFCRSHSRFSHGTSQFRGNGSRRALLDHLLVISLNGTVAFSQMGHIPLAVCQDLKFNVPGMLHKMFDIHCAVAKGGFRLFFCGKKCLRKFLSGPGGTHTFSTAAQSSLHDHGITDPVCLFFSFFHFEDWMVGPRNYRDPRRYHGVSCDLLVSQSPDHVG